MGWVADQLVHLGGHVARGHLVLAAGIGAEAHVGSGSYLTLAIDNEGEEGSQEDDGNDEGDEEAGVVLGGD